MREDPEIRTERPQITWAGVEWAIEAPKEGKNPQASVGFADHIQADRAFLKRVFGATPCSCVETFTASTHSSLSQRRRARRAALRHPAVARLLGGWSKVLGVDQIWRRDRSAADGPVFEVHVINYDIREMLRIRVDDGQVAEVQSVGLHEYPESPLEVRDAVALARLDAAIAESVRDLEAHAILHVPTQEEGYLGRYIWVAFTERNEPTRQLPAKFVALVDVGAGRVLSSGPAPCAGCTHPGETEMLA